MAIAMFKCDKCGNDTHPDDIFKSELSIHGRHDVCKKCNVKEQIAKIEAEILIESSKIETANNVIVLLEKKKASLTRVLEALKERELNGK